MTKTSTFAGKGVRYGETVDYTVTLTNNGGVDFGDPSVTDDLAKVLDDADPAGTPTAKLTPGGADAGPKPVIAAGKLTWTWTGGTIAVGQSVVITYQVKAPEQPKSGGDKSLENKVVVPGSNCGTGSSDAKCLSKIGLSAVLIKKTADDDTVDAGGMVTYTVEIVNSGPGAYGDLDLADDLSKADGDRVDPDSLTVEPDSLEKPRWDGTKGITWFGTVGPNSTVKLSYAVLVNPVATGARTLVNKVTANTPATNCSTANPIGDATACAISVQVTWLSLKVAVDKTAAQPGGTVTFTTTLKNEGPGDFYEASLDDDLTELITSGKVDPASITAKWASGSRAGTSAGTVKPVPSASDIKGIRWELPGAFEAGESVAITYKVTVGNTPPAPYQMVNDVSAQGTPCYDQASPDVCRQTVKLAALGVIKDIPPPAPPFAPEATQLADPAFTVAKKILKVNGAAPTRSPLKPGDVVTFLIEVVGPATGVANPVVVQDQLSGVVDDTTEPVKVRSIDPATGQDRADARYHAGTKDIALSGVGDLAANAKIHVSYDVTIKKDGTGDKRLVSKLIGFKNNNCAAPAAAPECNLSVPMTFVVVVKERP